MVCRPVKWFHPFRLTQAWLTGFSDRRRLLVLEDWYRPSTLSLPQSKKLNMFSWENIFKSILFAGPSKVILILFVCKYNAWSKQVRKERNGSGGRNGARWLMELSLLASRPVSKTVCWGGPPRYLLASHIQHVMTSTYVLCPSPRTLLQTHSSPCVE